ncbi:response regulator transcription factor [Streptomyces sp. NPDC020742]|uniref:response regulator transcription factor n=1 Tax=unclassified Streptomyces TaxID=2593676 RepID=UPI0033C06F9A
MIRVLVADDDQFVRQGLTTILETSTDIHVVAQAEDGREAVEAARRFAPDIALLDVRMPRVDGLRAAWKMRTLPSPPRVVMLTSFGEDEYIAEAVRAGAAGFLTKDTPPGGLIEAVRTVASGHGMLSPAVTVQVLSALRRRSGAVTAELREQLASLTPRERTVLVLLATGLPNTGIGARLDMTEATVKGHVTRILTKLGAANRVQAALLADRAGLAE